MTEEESQASGFLKAVVELSREWGLSLSHEDGHGAFLVEPANEDNYAWLLEARVRTVATR